MMVCFLSSHRLPSTLASVWLELYFSSAYKGSCVYTGPTSKFWDHLPIWRSTVPKDNTTMRVTLGKDHGARFEFCLPQAMQNSKTTPNFFRLLGSCPQIILKKPLTPICLVVWNSEVWTIQEFDDLSGTQPIPFGHLNSSRSKGSVFVNSKTPGSQNSPILGPVPQTPDERSRAQWCHVREERVETQVCGCSMKSSPL